MDKEKPLDVSGLRMKVNGHLNKVTGIRIVTDGDRLKWLQFGVSDEASNHHQCIEFEVSGLIHLWDSLTGVPGQVRALAKEVSSFGNDISNRFERAVKAFQSDVTK